MTDVNDLNVLETPPPIWDGFGFYTDILDKKVKFFYLDDIARVHGQLPAIMDVPADREAYHVLLSSVRKGQVHIELPFTSTFLDPFVYARTVAQAGFTGIMLKVNRLSLLLLEETLKMVMMAHAKGRGFVMQNEKGVEIFYEGAKKK
jgi:hypothetical protein